MVVVVVITYMGGEGLGRSISLYLNDSGLLGSNATTLSSPPTFSHLGHYEASASYMTPPTIFKVTSPLSWVTLHSCTSHLCETLGILLDR